jgi:hypothetical protein
MRKIVIISYYFPPSNFAGSYRIASWAKYLNRFGYYPIIVTRTWNKEQVYIVTKVEDNSYKHEKHTGYEVIYVPQKDNLRDDLYNKYGDTRFVLLRKILSLFQLIFQNFSNLAIPYSAIYDTVYRLIRDDKDIRLVLISGGPFESFRFGYLLHKNLGIKWAPDYRDGWQIWEHLTASGWMIRLLAKLESQSEKKWCSTASFFTATTDHIVSENEKVLPLKGYKILNGYDEDDYKHERSRPQAKREKLTLLYNGTTYQTQDLESFIAVYKAFINKLMQSGEASPKVELIFLGLAAKPVEEKRVLNLTRDIAPYIKITPRANKAEAIKAQVNADILLFFPHTRNVIGNYPSKIFEYFACGNPILFYPTDHDVIEQIIKETNTGSSFVTGEEALDFLDKAYELFKKGEKPVYHPDLQQIEQYTRENQTKKLAGVMDKYLSA